MKNRGLLALATLIGMVVGAGIFGLPYIIAQSGIFTGLFYFLILGGAIMMIHLFYGEIVLRTKEKHRLIGYSEKYLGSWGKFFVSISFVLGVGGALLAYLILAGDFLEILLSPFIHNLTSFHYSLVFWFIAFFFIFRGVKLVAPTEVFTNILFFLIIFGIFFFCLPKISPTNFILFNLPNVFLPYGVILFSLIAFSAIPEVIEILKTPENKRNFKKIVFIATGIVVLLYLLFIVSVVGIIGDQTTPNVFSGLKSFLPENVIFLMVFAGLLTIADSFLVLALSFKKTLLYDFKIQGKIAALMACGLPLVLFLAGFRNFIETISIVGILIGVIEGAVIILIFKKIKLHGNREPEFSLTVPKVFLYSLILILVFGAISQIINRLL